MKQSSDQQLRYVRRWSGIVTLLALAIFFAAVLHAGVLQNLFRSELTLRVILAESGSAGLSPGANVEVLGTTAGKVVEIVLDPNASFYAVVRIDKAMEPFIRADSAAYIRKQFGIAGAAYMEITRGRGAPLDWDFAVLNTREEAAPTATLGELMAILREKILPVVDDTHRTIRATAQLMEQVVSPTGQVQVTLDNLAKVSSQIAAGEGNVGRLLNDDRMVRDLETTVAGLKTTMESVSVVVANLQATSATVAKMTAGIGEQSQKLPQMIDSTNQTLQSLNGIMAEMSRTMPEITAMVRNSADASKTLPTLLAQTQQTLSELERLLVQLQGSWLFGGGSGAQATDRGGRLSPAEARP